MDVHPIRWLPLIPKLWPQVGLLAIATIATSSQAFAQHTHDHSDSTATASAATHSMAGMDMSSPNNDWMMAAMASHMAYSSARSLTMADSARSAKIVNDLRQAIAKYQDVKVAEADGYKMFAPQLKNQPQYHFTKSWNAIRNQFGFDPARPTSLLYKKMHRGRCILSARCTPLRSGRPRTS